MTRRGFTLPEIEEILLIRGSSDFGEGVDQRTVAGTRFRGLKKYKKDPRNSHKLLHQKERNNLILPVLPIGHPPSYEQLYAAGRLYSIKNGTTDRREIKKHLGKLFSCYIKKMTWNMN